MLAPGTRAFKVVPAKSLPPSVANAVFARSYLLNETEGFWDP